MPSPMSITLSIPHFMYIVSSRSINFFTRDACFGYIATSLLSFFYNCIYFMMFFSCLTNYWSSCHISMISSVLCCCINYNKISFFKLPIRWDSMRQRAIRACCNNWRISFTISILSVFRY